MYLFDFQAKLKKLNRDVYVRTESRNTVDTGIYVTGIYRKYRRKPSAISRGDRGYSDTKQQKYLDALEKGQLDTFLCGVSLNYVPEYDILDLDRERLLMPGWRSIAMSLVKQKVCSLSKARKVFGCSSLGESTYDKLSVAKKIAWAKGVNGSCLL